MWHPPSHLQDSRWAAAGVKVPQAGNLLCRKSEGKKALFIPSGRKKGCVLRADVLEKEGGAGR